LKPGQELVTLISVMSEVLREAMKIWSLPVFHSFML